MEYSADLVFRSQAMLQPLYEQLCRQAVLSVKAEHVPNFLGHKIASALHGSCRGTSCRTLDRSEEQRLPIAVGRRSPANPRLWLR